MSQFAVHLGIARGSSVIMLEQTGRNSGYGDKDVCGFCPDSHCCVEGGPEKLDSIINMRDVSKEFKQAGRAVLYSRDAGRYASVPELSLLTLKNMSYTLCPLQVPV